MKNTRLEATRYIWTAFAFALVALFISGGIANGIQAAHVVLGIVIAIAATGATGFIWNFGDYEETVMIGEDNAIEKAKRERLDKVIRELSSEELIALKRRLSDGTIDDDLLYERMTLSDDGELMPVERD